MTGNAQLATKLSQIYALRFATISGTAIITYDTILTFSDEVHYVWSTISLAGTSQTRLRLAKILYLCGRYTMIATCIVNIMALIPPHAVDGNWCYRMYAFSSIADTSIETLASGLVFYRLHSLWMFNRYKTNVMVALLFALKAVVMGLTIAVVVNLDAFNYNFVNACGGHFRSPENFASWIIAFTSDIVAFTLFILNALYRPRLGSHRLADILYCDGAVFFAVLLTTRGLNLFLTAFAPTSLKLLCTGLTGSIVATISSRTFLGLFRAESMDDEEVIDDRHLSLVSKDANRSFSSSSSYDRAGSTYIQSFVCRTESYRRYW